MNWPWGRLQRAGAMALVVGSLAIALFRCSVSNDVPFVWPSESAPWKMAFGRVEAALQQWGRVDAPRTVFSRRFELAVVPESASLELRALGAFTVRANGIVPEGGRSDGSSWRARRRLEIAPVLRSGGNEIQVEVENLRGPALLEARLSGLPDEVTAERWDTSLDGRRLGPAVPAKDTAVNPASYAVETPLEALRERVGAISVLAVFGAVGLALGLRLPAARRAALPVYALVAAVLAWGWLFVRKFLAIPPTVGFDAPNHLDYVDFLLRERALPLATDGWSMYHPPLFYAIAAAVKSLGDRALALLPWLAGLGQVFVAKALATRLFPGDGRVALLAVCFAAALPINIYTAAYFSNEAPHALLVGLALVASVDALQAPRTTMRQALWLSLWLGLAALTKFTAIAVAAVALFFLACKLLAVERAPRRAFGLTGLAAGTAFAIAGWFYLRSWVRLGSPLVGNWNLPQPDQVWWQQPGFHTPAYYLGFGESLRHSYHSAFFSFWDGLYSTLWGDGGIAGRTLPTSRHPFWSYDFMSAGYLLALPATALLLYGAWRCVRIALHDPDPRRRAAFSFIATAVFAIFYSILSLTLSLPYFGQAKAFYGLCMTAPLAVFFAAGAAHVDTALEGRRRLRLAFAGLITAMLGTFFLGFAA